MTLHPMNEQEVCRGKLARLEGKRDDLGAFCHGSNGRPVVKCHSGGDSGASLTERTTIAMGYTVSTMESKGSHSPLS
jgi:hypothetical protein